MPSIWLPISIQKDDMKDIMNSRGHLNSDSATVLKNARSYGNGVANTVTKSDESSKIAIFLLNASALIYKHL